MVTQTVWHLLAQKEGESQFCMLAGVLECRYRPVAILQHPHRQLLWIPMWTEDW